MKYIIEKTVEPDGEWFRAYRIDGGKKEWMMYTARSMKSCEEHLRLGLMVKDPVIVKELELPDNKVMSDFSFTTKDLREEQV